MESWVVCKSLQRDCELQEARDAFKGLLSHGHFATFVFQLCCFRFDHHAFSTIVVVLLVLRRQCPVRFAFTEERPHNPTMRNTCERSY